MMDVRGKLIDIVEKASARTLPKNTCHTNIVMLVNALIEEGVTVQEWISVKDRLPTEDEDRNHRIVGVVNGYNGKIRFTDAEIFVRYCHTENAWWSDDYDIEGCTVEKFYVLPKPPKGE